MAGWLRRVLAVGLMLALPVGGLADGSAPTVSPSLPAVATTPARVCGTVIVPPGVGSGTPPASVTELNPLFDDSAYNGEAVALLYSPVFWVNREHVIDWSRSIATGIKVSKHDTVFTVSMRPWVWSDGAPVTSADVKYEFDLIKKLGPTYLQYGGGGIPTVVKSFKLQGPETFVVTTLHPVNPDWFEIAGLSTLFPLPQHVWGKYNINQMWRRQSDPSFFKVVDGPFRVVSFKMGRHIVFGPNLSFPGHKAQIHRFIMKFLHSSGAEIEGLRTGSVDISNLPLSLWNEGHTLSGVRLVRMLPNFGFNYLQINFRNPKVAFFRSVKVRQAIADALDQKKASHLLDHDLVPVEYGPVPVEPPTFLSPSAKAGHYPVGYDPAKARALLRAAGWKKGPDGIRVKNGKRLSFTYLAYSGGATALLVTELQQQELRAVGIEMKIRIVTFNQLLALSQRPLAWEATGFGWDMGSYPSDGVQLRTNAPYNQEGYSDKKMDRLLNDVDTKPGMEALYKYQDYAAEQQPEIFEGSPGSVVLVRKGLRGVNKFLSPTAVWSPQYLHFTTPDCQGEKVTVKGAAR
ncbi:MAG TPA: peptide ABC transporter substrate-binding protein [Acidiphilium sp.]|nr:peptide ABC transporter substrate-binding protein [Acidiphilium sp.]